MKKTLMVETSELTKLFQKESAQLDENSQEVETEVVSTEEVIVVETEEVLGADNRNQ
jgi:hypothetical protein